MSYRPNPRHTYMPRRKQPAFTPATHLNFKQEWEANFDGAVAQAEALRSQGYLVEDGIQKGALTESNAQKMAAQLQSEGYDVQFIPVASWGGEKVVFVVFKPPKDGEVAKSPVPKQTGDLKVLMEVFVNFVGVDDVEKQLSEQGFIFDRSYTIALVPKDQQQSRNNLTKWAKEVLAKDPLLVFDNTPALRRAVSAAKIRDKKSVLALDVDKTLTIDIEKFQKVLHVFGAGEIKAYVAPVADGPLFFFNRDGHAIAVARFEASDSKTVTLPSLLRTI